MEFILHVVVYTSPVGESGVLPYPIGIISIRISIAISLPAVHRIMVSPTVGTTWKVGHLYLDLLAIRRQASRGLLNCSRSSEDVRPHIMPFRGFITLSHS